MEAESTMNWIWTILGTIFAAMIYSISAYWKKAQAGEEFDTTKFLTTVLFGFVVAIFAIVTKAGVENAYVTLMGTGFVTVILENIVSAIIRWWNARKAAKSAKLVSKKK